MYSTAHERGKRLGALEMSVDLSQLPFCHARPQRHPGDSKDTELEFVKMLAVDPPVKNIIAQLRVVNPLELSASDFRNPNIHEQRHMTLLAWLRDPGVLISYLLIEEGWKWCVGLDRACMIKWNADGARIVFLERART